MAPELYSKLVRRIAEAEQAHDKDDAETLALARKLDLRRCPECSTIIEKNEGCQSMACYLCGVSLSLVALAKQLAN